MTSRRGFALLAAVWLLVALSALGTAFALRGRERRLSAANAIEATRAAAAARAGLEHARSQLEGALRFAEPAAPTRDAGRPLDPWWDVGGMLPDTVRLGVAGYHVHLRDANAALHLNRASEAELRQLLVGLRVDAGRADRIAQAVADWRDRDEFRHARGAETRDYLESGLAVLPRNSPFEDPSELRHVMHVTADVYERVRPYVTVLGSGQVNLNAASRPVLLSLPGMSEEAADAVVRIRRGRRPVANLQEIGLQLSAGARTRLLDAMPQLLPRVTFATREVEAVAVGWTDGGRTQVRALALFARIGTDAVPVWRRLER